MSIEGQRPAVTVVILGSARGPHLKQLLAAVEPELRRGDNLVLLEEKDSMRRAAAWRARTARGLERSQAPLNANELVLVLDDRILLGAGLLDALVNVLVLPDVGAVGASSNVADGDDLIRAVPYRPFDHGARRAALRASCGGHSSVEWLGGPCILLRRSHLERAGGIAGLCSGVLTAALTKLREDGLRLVVADGAYVHHFGGSLRQPRPAGQPFLSACMIVKNEENELEASLESVACVADEVVVYDTGSTDGTVALARKLGARVIEGYWDDDFSRARNAALEHCRGQWILWIDADESLVCSDPATLRSSLAATSSTTEGYLVQIDNLRGTAASTAFAHPAVRLFRRSACHWNGRLHEQVVRRHEGADPALAAIDAARISHRGYLQHAIRDRDKAGRNLRNAFTDLAGQSELDLGTRLLSLARSYMLAGRYAEGAALAEQSLVHTTNPPTIRLAFRSMAESALALGHPGEALEVAKRLRAKSRVPALAATIEARAHLAREDGDRALATLDTIGCVVDDDGFEYGPHLVADVRAKALVLLGRHAEAADVLLRTLREQGGIDTHLGLLIESLEAAGRSAAEIAEVVGSERLAAFVPQILQLQPPAADRTLEAWHLVLPSCLPVLAAAARVAPRLAIERQLQWSARLRSAGLAHACPLVTAATLPDVPADERALSAAVAVASFGDPRARYAFCASVLGLSADERQVLQIQVAALAPPLLASLDALSPARRSPAARTTPQDARRVLVIGRHVSDRRAAALATACARAGHDTTVLCPQPAAPLEEYVAGFGVKVHGWTEASPADFVEQCSAVIARTASAATYEAVLLSPGTEEVREACGTLLPRAALLTPDASWADAGRSVLIGELAPVPRTERTGILVVTALRDVDAATRSAYGQLLATVGSTLGDVPIAACGDDPDRWAPRSLPTVLDLGPIADATAWVRASSVLLLAAGEEKNEWVALAAHCGTPLVELAPDDAPASVVAALRNAQKSELPAGTPAGASEALVSIPDRREVTGGAAEVLFSSGCLPAEEADHLLEIVTRLCPLPVSRAPRAPYEGAPPGDGRLSLCALEFARGGLPAEWCAPLRDVEAQCWVPSAWARERAVASGLDPDLVFVVPPPVDPLLFRPADAPATGGDRALRLLFVGALSPDSAIDALLEVYVGTLAEHVPTRLVVLPTPPAPGFSVDAGFERAVRAVLADLGANVELHDGPITAAQEAELYRSSDVLLAPHRADAAARNVRRALGCGLPIVWTAGTAADELCDERLGWRVASRSEQLDGDTYTPTTAGFAWQEPERDSLADALSAVIHDAERRRAACARARHSALRTTDLVVESRLQALFGAPNTGGTDR